MSLHHLRICLEQNPSDFTQILISDINKISNVSLSSFANVSELDSLSSETPSVVFLWKDSQILEKQKLLFEKLPSVPYILLSDSEITKQELNDFAHPTRLYLCKESYSEKLLSLMLDFAERFVSDMTRSFEFDRMKERIAILENVFEESLDILIQVDPSTKHIIGINKQALSALGYEKEEIIGKDFSFLIPPVSDDEDTEFQGSLIAGSALITKTGDIIPTESSFRLFTASGKMAIWATFRDISERKKAQEQVKTQKAFYEFILDNIDSDISVLDSSFNYEYLNPVLIADEEIRKWIYQKNDKDVALKLNLPDEFSEKRKKFLEIALSKNENVQFEELIQDVSDTKKYLLRKYIPIEDSESGKRRIISYGVDITDRKIAEERISYLAYYDSLTGLANRTLFIDHSNQALKNHKTSQTLLAFYFFDIDNFKFINDSLGHTKGDMLLQMVGARLKRLLTEVDTVARFGGDEFAILKVDIENKGKAAEFAQKVFDILSQPFHITGRDLYTTISMGIALSPNDGISALELLKNADMAMYKAKELGRSNFKFYTNELILRSEKRLYIENSLRKALQNNELCLFFQPQISMETDKVCGAEALIRWKHPERGWVPPVEFIPVAEDTGMIESIGEWVLEEACRLKKSWNENNLNGFNVSINVSGKQLMKNNWAHKVQSTIENFNLKAEEIELELTESSIMENPERSIESFRYLSGLGIKVSIDDFGTGYSSLSYLKKIDADVLKIDRSFVMDLEQNEDDQAICRAIINMAVSLGMEVIAEGVENEVQRNVLKNFGCHIIQGYYYSKPLPTEDFVEFVKKINHST
ncbi:sensor domain-containing protein [Leptospira idonii]|uniref:EAL domain-containing protein n=1 Tax=Leptospira idonii TaxID=1193500 RepID=A0A4V3JY99_9LEPT|nr:EAL domain-containing protein [Leptospira idonii]TGN20276.1 EAL domain-containing protein [Leptospira idonii]